MTVTRATRLLPLACVAGAIVLFASQLMTMFEFTPPGAEPLASRSVIDHHGPALAVIAVFAALLVVVTVWVGSKPAAVATGAMGGIALLLFLLIDLPDAGQVGTLDDARQSFFEAEAVPQEGFWLEMLGALGLGLSGIALATLPPEQLAALRPVRLTPRDRGARERAGTEPASEPSESPAAPYNAEEREAAREVTEEPAHRLPPRRSRPRQRR